MKTTKVSYTKTYPIPSTGVWEKIFVEAELEPGDDARFCLYNCKKIVENFHFESNKADEKKANGNVGEFKIEYVSTDIEKPSTLSKVASIIKDIGTVTDLKVLESYHFIARNDADIQAAYDKKKYELQQPVIKQILDATEALTKK